jgi:hypothetical protein
MAKTLAERVSEAEKIVQSACEFCYSGACSVPFHISVRRLIALVRAEQADRCMNLAADERPAHYIDSLRAERDRLLAEVEK